MRSIMMEQPVWLAMFVYMNTSAAIGVNWVVILMVKQKEINREIQYPLIQLETEWLLELGQMMVRVVMQVMYAYMNTAAEVGLNWAVILMVKLQKIILEFQSH